MHRISFPVGVLVGMIFSSALVIAWTGPASTPPDGNVSTPINTGMLSQIKDGPLQVNGFQNMGQTLLSGSSLYLNFGDISGEEGYGFRDNAGTMEFKDEDGSWSKVARVPECIKEGATLMWSAAQHMWTCNEPPDVDASSCKNILSSGGSTGTGVYTIDPDAGGPTSPFSAYCDMTTSGGGWTLIVKGSNTEINSADPPNFDVCSTLWTTAGASYGSPDGSTHFSPAWSQTPSFTEFLWQESATNYVESGLTYTGNLKDWVKTTGTVRLNTGITAGVGGGGRIYRTTTSGMCNIPSDGSSAWGTGFAPVRVCSSRGTYGSRTCLTGSITYETGFSPSAALWVR